MESWGIVIAVAVLLGVMTRVYGSMIDRLEKEEVRLRLQNTSQQQQINSVKDKAGLIWDFQMRRAHVEALKQDKNMPLLTQCELVTSARVPQQVREAFQPMIQSLKDFYSQAKQLVYPLEVDDGELCLQIEKDFGDWIVENLCIPFNQTHGECLIYALRLAKE